ncbi:MAG: putative toxin-antitoxin system toxin component, PIN family [Candidatus Natronoplasma sp.]
MGERKLKVVLDTNVLISALGWSGPPSDCLNLIIEEDIINFISEPILEELMDVMDYPKFKFTKEEKEEFLEIVISYSILVDPAEKVEKIKKDPDDNKFLECSIKADADYIISGDQHLLGLKRFKGIEIISPKEFLELRK